VDDNSFVFGIILISLLATLIVTWMLIRLGHKIADAKAKAVGSAGSAETVRELQLVTSENAGLKGQVTHLEDRIAVLERIVTDPAERTAREIERLRHDREQG
jgi:hypothetical protein